MRNRLRGLVLLAVLALTGIIGLPVSAQVPAITVNPVWRPAVQLTTIDVNGNGITEAGDDIRFATVDIYATGNIEFWAVGFTCTVNKLALETYILSGDANSGEDDTAPFVEGSDWSSFTKQAVNTTDTDGKINFAISVSGEGNAPMGSNGLTKTLHIATLKYRVKEGLTLATTSPFTCVMSFLNRDGKVVLPGVFVPPTVLSIIPGYQLNGKVTYQGTTTALTPAQAITVQCDDSDGDAVFDDVVTTANTTTGLFSVNNLRSQGRYDCQFVGNIRTPGDGNDLHLSGTTNFNLSTGSFTVLPVVLRSGNVDSSDTVINSVDVTAVTSNWSAPLTTLTAPYLLGDASGDRKINEADLALVSSNFARTNLFDAQHLIYSMPRDVSLFQNSHLWLGALNNVSITSFLPGATRDYWPTVSPDGTKIAFIRNVGTGTANKFALYTAPIVSGVVGAATRLTPATATYDAFAPSWSPDGSQLALVCSYNAEWFSATTASGDLCLIDASGLNFRVPVDTNIHRTIQVRIQPPAWANSAVIFIAVMGDAGITNICDKRVCTMDIPNLILSAQNFLPAGSDFPVVRNTSLGSTLFYRFDNGAGSRTIRFTTLLPVSGSITSAYPDTSSPTFHADVLASADGVAYFTVSTGADPDVFFYENDPLTDDAGGSTFRTFVFNGNVTSPAWSAGFSNTTRISDVVNNPVLASGYFDALLNTAAYVP